MIEVKHLEKYYGSDGTVTKALDDISFISYDGEFLCIMGASGSGKSTLLNCLSTIDCASAGDILFNGVSFDSLKKSELAAFRRHNLGFIFQNYNLLDTLTLGENISLSLLINGAAQGTIQKRIHDSSFTVSLSLIAVVAISIFTFNYRLSLVPFTFSIITSQNQNHLADYDIYIKEKYPNSHSCTYTIYQSTSSAFTSSIPGFTLYNAVIMPYSEFDLCISHSDYSALRSLLGYAPISLNENEYIVHCLSSFQGTFKTWAPHPADGRHSSLQSIGRLPQIAVCHRLTVHKTVRPLAPCVPPRVRKPGQWCPE